MITTWKSCTIGDVIQLQRGYDITKKEQKPGPIPVYSSGGLSSFHDVAMVGGPGVIMGRKGTLGRVYYSEVPFWPHDTTLWVRDFKGSDPRFVYYFLQTLDFEYMNVGSANPTLNRNHVHPLPTSWPSVPEQRAIGETLGVLDDKIAVNRRISIAAVGLGKTQILGSPLTSAPLGDIANILMGSSPKGEDLNEEGNGEPFFQGVRDFGSLYPSKRVFTTNPVRDAPPGAVLFAVRAPVGAVNLATETVVIGRGLAAISLPGRPASLYFAMRAFNSIWDEHQGGGTVFASVNGKDVRSAMLPLPVGDSAGKLEEHLAGLLARAIQAEKESERLAATRDELLPLLMNGKITVKDAEKTVEDVV